MKQGVAMPFRVLGDDAVLFRGWQLGDADQPLTTAEDTLENWDYARSLETLAELEVDVSKASEQLEIPTSEIELSAHLRLGTGAGNIPRRVETVATALLNAGNQRAELGSKIEGRTLSGRLRFEISIVLAKEPKSRSELSPSLVGSRLWSTRKEILIEDGGSGRFPIESVDFSKFELTRSIIDAPWFIHWRTSRIDADFGGAVRVYINSSIEEVHQRLIASDPATLQAILADVMSQMIEHAVRTEGFREAASDCPEGSIGDQMVKWLSLAFPDRSDANILAEIDVSPGLFRATVLNAASLASTL